MQKKKEDGDNNEDHAAYQIALIYAFRGEIDLAFDWLNEAYDDPRWIPLLDKVGLPH